MKVFNPAFSINIASKVKKESRKSKDIISRKCLAVVIKLDGEYKAVVNYNNKPIYFKEDSDATSEKIIIPFTENSLSLKNKEYVFLKEKDKYGHNVCIIRTNESANLNPGVNTQYDSVRENLLIAGHIVNKNNKMYFEYENLIAYHHLSEYHICEVKIDNSKPLFNK